MYSIGFIPGELLVAGGKGKKEYIYIYIYILGWFQNMDRPSVMLFFPL